MLSTRGCIHNWIRLDSRDILKKVIHNKGKSYYGNEFSTCISTPIVKVQSLEIPQVRRITWSKFKCIKAFHIQSSLSCDISIRNVKKNEQENGDINNNFSEGTRQDNSYINSNKYIPKHTEYLRHTKNYNITIKDLEKLYPEPRNTLHSVFSIISSELKKTNSLFTSYIKHQNNDKTYWTCEYKINWPEPMTFSATESHKKLASKIAAYKCLHWLHENKKLINGKPVLYNKEEVNKMLKEADKIDIDPSILAQLKYLIKEYQNDIKHIVSKSSDVNIEEENSLDQNLLVNGEKQEVPLISHPTLSPTARDDRLLIQMMRRKLKKSLHLPIYNFREEILKTLEQNQVVLIKGDTGCGKTTQVPQFILDYMTEQNYASDCNMIVSQPRRIAAITLADRVAKERGENIGDVIGYQVRLQQKLPQTPGAILFCTTGVLLRKLQSNPTLKGCSHVILDEAHERSIDTDMLMVLLKRAMNQNPNLKVIIMSATINAELFQNYFNCPGINVPGMMYPVKMHFLEDIENIGIGSSYDRVTDNWFDNIYVDCERIVRLVQWISENKPSGAILCFLPGWMEIVRVQRLLENAPQSRQMMVVPIHSKISYVDQKKIFDNPPDGMRKVILATDIAETGITVPDVVYVVDSAIRKETRWSDENCLSTMQNTIISMANIEQRKGRAGRVQPGESYHCITKEKYENLEPYPLPEILRSSLEKTVLDCKTYSNEKAKQFLGDMPQPPTTSAINKAVLELEKLGALDSNENLTALGKRIARFTLHPKMGKALVLSSIFQCVNPILSISSVFSLDSEMFSDVLKDKTGIRNVKKHFHPASDHLAVAWIFTQWESLFAKDEFEAMTFCKKNRLHPERMKILQKVRDQNAMQLQECKMLEEGDNCKDLMSDKNTYAGLDEMVRAVLLSATNHVLKHKKLIMFNNRLKKNDLIVTMEQGNRGVITPESVNYKRTVWPSPYLTYYKKMHSEERRAMLIRETSMISPLTVLLFSSGNIFSLQHMASKDGNDFIELEIEDKFNVKLTCEAKCVLPILQFREVMWAITNYLIEKQGYVKFEPESDIVKVDNFKRKMFDVLAKILNDASISIDYPDPTIEKTVDNKKKDVIR